MTPKIAYRKTRIPHSYEVVVDGQVKGRVFPSWNRASGHGWLYKEPDGRSPSDSAFVYRTRQDAARALLGERVEMRTNL